MDMIAVSHSQLTKPLSQINWHGSGIRDTTSLLQLTLGVGQPPPVQFTVMFPDEWRDSSIFCV